MWGPQILNGKSSSERHGRHTYFAGFTGHSRNCYTNSVDPCSQWYAANRNRLLVFWILGSVCLGVLAFYIHRKFGVVWIGFAVLGFVVVEKLLLRRVDQAAPR
jgi:hypothetical protein